MKHGAGKRKGNAFERQICKSLSLWVTGGRRDDVLWRSAMSGGRATVHAKRGRSLRHVAGDICAVADEGNALIDVFFLECKFYRDLNTPRIVFDGSGGKLHEFWLRTADAASSYNKMPMLIAKQNMVQPVVVLDTHSLIGFGLTAHIRFTSGDGNIVTFTRFVEQASVAALKKWQGRG